MLFARKGSKAEKIYLFGKISEQYVLEILTGIAELVGDRIRKQRQDRSHRDRLNRLLRGISEVCKAQGHMEISEIHGSLFINGIMLSVVSQDHEAVQGLIVLLIASHIHQIKFTDGLQAEELGLFFNALSRAELQRAKPHITPHITLAFHADVRTDEERSASRESAGSMRPDQLLEKLSGTSAEVEPETSGYRYDKVEFADKAKLAGKHKVHIFAYVGEIKMDGAQVSIVTDKGSTVRETKEGRPAIFYLVPGSYEARVEYEKFSKPYAFQVVNEDLELEVDLQSR